jgi:23S rRNA U2552 (ribose-2'-O)-methylase RlmE/FtsJ
MADFHTITRARTLPASTNITDEIVRTAIDLLEMTGIPGVDILQLDFLDPSAPTERRALRAPFCNRWHASQLS